MIYGARLRQAREFNKLTQRAVDQEIGLNQGRLSEAERDAYALSAAALVEFAELTGFPVEFFLRTSRELLSIPRLSIFGRVLECEQRMRAKRNLQGR